MLFRSLSGAAAAGQATEDPSGQHEDEQHREHEQNSDGGKELLAVLRGGGDGLAGLDGPMDGLSRAGRLGQAACFLVVQFWIPPCRLVDFI